MGKICAFFGRKNIWGEDTKEEVKENLRKVIENLIVTEGVDIFWVGGHGEFDFIAGQITRELKEKYPFIETWLILAYASQLHQSKPLVKFDVFLYPEEIERCKKLYAIPARNQYMVKHCDYVVSYVEGWGGSYKAVKFALKKNKTVINLGSWNLVEDLG